MAMSSPPRGHKTMVHGPPATDQESGDHLPLKDIETLTWGAFLVNVVGSTQLAQLDESNSIRDAPVYQIPYPDIPLVSSRFVEIGFNIHDGQGGD